MKRILSVIYYTIFLLVMLFIVGCSDKENKVYEIRTENTIPKPDNKLSVGDTLYYKYIADYPVMFIIEKIDIKQKVFIGKQSNIYDPTLLSREILPFETYFEKRFN